IDPTKMRSRWKLLTAGLTVAAVAGMIGLGGVSSLLAQASPRVPRQINRPVVLASISLIQTSSAGSANGATTLSATFPGSPTSGNLLVAIAGCKPGDSMVAPSGWSTAFNQPGVTSPGSRPGLAIFYKVAGGAESSTVTVTSPGSTLGL